MLKTKMSSLVALGSARRETRAVSGGSHMELVGGEYYDKPGVGVEVTRLGSARQETRAIDGGARSELIPDWFYTPASVRLD